MSVGVEWIVDAEGCDPAPLRDAARVCGVLAGVIEGLSLRVVGEGHVHTFGGGGGVTALYLLMESHLACHTYPERGVATINLYCCHERAEWPWRDALAAAFGATRVTVRTLTRAAGGVATTASPNHESRDP